MSRTATPTWSKRWVNAIHPHLPDSMTGVPPNPLVACDTVVRMRASVFKPGAAWSSKTPADSPAMGDGGFPRGDGGSHRADSPAGSGDRRVLFAFTWSFTGDLLEGLEGTSRGGVRYPIPVAMRSTVTMPQLYQERLRMLEEEPDMG